MFIIKKFGNVGGGERWGEGGRSRWEGEDKYKFKNCLQGGINPLPILHMSFDSFYTFNKMRSYVLFYYKVSHRLCSNIALSKQKIKILLSIS